MTEINSLFPRLEQENYKNGGGKGNVNRI